MIISFQNVNRSIFGKIGEDLSRSRKGNSFTRTIGKSEDLTFGLLELLTSRRDRMELTKNNGPLSINRRDFLKAAGIGAVAMSMPGLIRNTGAASMSNVSQEVIKTDVLVIGGGIAGVFAAIKAKEQGVDVTIADKGTVGNQGSAPGLVHILTLIRQAVPQKSSIMNISHRKVNTLQTWIIRKSLLKIP